MVEVSSFQLRFCEEFHPTAAAITNLAVDHLDWHGSEHSYRAAKARIFMNQSHEDLLGFDADDEGANLLVAGRRASYSPSPAGISRQAGEGRGRMSRHR